MHNHRLLCLGSALLLAACSGSSVKETLGLENKAPDEFRVVSRPPLSVPPEFELRPPMPGDGSIAATPADKQARSLVTGTAVSLTPASSGGETFVLKNEGAAPAEPKQKAAAKTPGVTSAEAELLSKAGAANADPMVRTTLIKEKAATFEKQEEASWWERWMTLPDKKDSLVNAGKESERIQQNQDAGRPVNEGETPTVKGKDRGILGRILGD